jgi:hypothetical protein
MNIKDLILPYGEQIHTGTADSILSSMYRDILSDLQIKEEGRFLMLINKYVTRTIPPEDISEISSVRNILRKNLMKSVMTWKVFIKGLKVLNVKKFDLAFHLKSTDGSSVEVAVIRTVLLDENAVKKEREINDSNKAISILFHDVLFEMNVNTSKFSSLIAEYIEKANIPSNIKEISSTRGNIKKELLKNTISWKVFIKGLMFLNVSRFDIGVSLHHTNGKITNHYRSVNLGTDLGDLDE